MTRVGLAAASSVFLALLVGVGLYTNSTNATVTKGAKKNPFSDIFEQNAAVEALLGEADPERRWALAFQYGEEAGLRLDLNAALERANRFTDRAQRANFWDGYAHTAPWPSDDPDAYLTEIGAFADADARVALQDGVLMRYAERHATDVQDVVSYADRWVAFARRAPTNGVRIGLQRTLGADPEAAIAKAAEYPTEWQGGLYEELGWRAGSQRAIPAEATIRQTEQVPSDSRCWYIHGAVRGRALHVSLDDAIALNAMAAEPCQAMGWRAIGWSLGQQQVELGALNQLGSSLPDGYSRALLDGYQVFAQRGSLYR